MAQVTTAGFHVDPYERHEERYFDGVRWTDHVMDGGVPGTDPCGSRAVALPPRPPRPNFARPMHRPLPAAPTPTVEPRSKWPRVLVVLILLFAAAFAGRGLLNLAEVNDGTRSFIDEQDNHSISRSQFDFIQVGTARAALIAGLAKEPTDPSTFASYVTGVKVSPDCIYFWETGRSFDHWYQLCFDGAGNLSTKTAAS